ncbi:DUF2182 domain-containing protein [Alkalimonas sp. NCh-2]|uniref:copper chaperone n=1 Tax=Alkalimonas sp. NCh-2 TaxID=3144846 RepID=UPI0031F6FF20
MKIRSYIWFLAQPPLPILLLISAIAWLLLYFGGHEHTAHQLSSTMQDMPMAHQHQMYSQPLAPVRELLHSALVQLSGWAMMVLAMMFPLLHNAIRHIWQRSLPRLRLLGSVLFCLGYLSLWFVVGLLCNLMLMALHNIPLTQIVLVASAIVLLWQASPMKQWGLNYCHYNQRLALSGWRYFYDCLSFGIKKGSWCIVSCWHLMVFPMLLDSFLLMFISMLTVCGWMFFEQHLSPRQVAWHVPFRFEYLRSSGRYKQVSG